MTCEWVTLPDGTRALACSRGGRPRRQRQCSELGCHRPATVLCKFPVADAETCDRALCERHRVRQGPNVYHCPEHAVQRDLFTPAALVPRRSRSPAND